MDVYRAPIRVEEIIQEESKFKTRSGYLVSEAYSCYETALGETGAVASGKALHFAADLVCSGGLDIWIRGAYSYAVSHISLANPRIFVYLKQRFAELDKKATLLPQEAFFKNNDVQSTVSETVLVLQLCPKRSKIVWPKIDINTTRPGWLRGVASSPETRATRTIWTTEDSPTLYLVANEICKAITDGASERVLFWIRWTMEEDGRMRKTTKTGLSTKGRGPAIQKNTTDAGHFLAALFSEIYKELAEKGLVRMHEEFGELMRLWRGSETRMPARYKRDCLGLMGLIVCEVPRWKVPAAPVLVEDPVRLSRAVSQCTSFFNEVLVHPSLPPSKQIKQAMTRKIKEAKTPKALTEKQKKENSLEEHFEAYDAIMDAYLNR